jgi:hypothetical protein
MVAEDTVTLQMLDSGGLPWFSQDKPRSPKMTRVSEILQISIFRTDHGQNLILWVTTAGSPFHGR